MKILVIFTGGTIGSTASGGWIAPRDSARFTLINNYASNHNGVEFDTLSPYTILSENLSAEELNKLTACVRVNAGSYDGIIVTHGTDTLQYTASALSFTVDCCNTPVVLVSANYPLGNERSNGNINFEAAVAFIGAKAGKGVYVSYKNPDDAAVHIHYGARVLGHIETMDEVFSIDNQPYAFYEDGKITLNTAFEKMRISRVSDVKFCAEPKILTVNSRPGDNYNYDVEKYNAILLAPYHSGTLNTANDGLMRLCERAQGCGVPVLLANVRSGDSYESTRSYADLGITVLPFCGVVQAYMKIWIAVSRGEDIVKFVKNPLAGEFIN